jgi:quercetin dioxygenase-like cupin family protein/DNA-binding transcriptional regulator YiaG
MKEEKVKRKTSAGLSSRRGKAAKHDDLLTAPTSVARTHEMGKEGETVGARIRRIREKRGLTLQDLSSRTGIDVDILKRAESGEVIPALGQLVRVGRALDKKVGYFISPGIDRLMTVVRKDERRPFSRYGETESLKCGYSYESLAPDKGNRMMEPFIVTLMPTETEEFSTHAGQEFLYVLEGELKVQVGDKADFLKPGDAAYYDSNQPHLVKCAGTSVTRILAVMHTGPK